MNFSEKKRNFEQNRGKSYGTPYEFFREIQDFEQNRGEIIWYTL